TLAELALEDTEQANIKSRNILVKEVVPNQALIIDGFMHLMQIIEEDVHSGSQQLYERHEAHNQSRMFTLLFILILSALVMYVVIKNILKIENRLYELSTSDALTGTLNRRSFDEKIQQEWKRTLRTEEPLSLLFIDIDYFKKYNDHYGHQEGDKCLIRIAGVLKNYSHRAGDSVARYGGEEFAMILPDVDKNGARTVAERLLERVRMENIPHTGSDISQYVTISIGQASLIPTINQSYEELIKASDLALYQSKRSGRNRVTTYTPEKDGKIIELFTSA
ncbi:MAG: GGDEF domain-containing protein, partial [Gammaproteobacteria bacterium]